MIIALAVSLSVKWLLRLPRLFPVLLLMAAAGSAQAAGEKVLGPNACAECHKDEAEAWKNTHHFKTYRELPRNKEARNIAKRMGIRRVKSDSLCLGCHFTVQKKGKRPKAVAGISCESCHGEGKDWIKVHSEFSGKTEQSESEAEEAARWAQAEKLGMNRPGKLYRLAKNCYSCHVVPEEKLVNVGKHPAGSAFELLSWTQGEIRHNTWYSKGKGNTPASANRKRILYLVGLAVELETALRAVGNATVRNLYSFKMAKRVDNARKAFEAGAKAVPQIPELKEISRLSYSAGLKLNNKAALTAAADGIGKQILSLVAKHDGSQLAALDPLLPDPGKFKGQARQP